MPITSPRAAGVNTYKAAMHVFQYGLALRRVSFKLHLLYQLIYHFVSFQEIEIELLYYCHHRMSSIMAAATRYFIFIFASSLAWLHINTLHFINNFAQPPYSPLPEHKYTGLSNYFGTYIATFATVPLAPYILPCFKDIFSRSVALAFDIVENINAAAKQAPAATAIRLYIDDDIIYFYLEIYAQHISLSFDARSFLLF